MSWFVPSPVAFQKTRWNSLFGGSPPMLYEIGIDGAKPWAPSVSRPTRVTLPAGES